MKNQALFSLIAVGGLILGQAGTGFAQTREDALSVAQIKSRLEVKGEIFYLSQDGTRLLGKGSQWRLWTPRVVDGKSQIESQWSSGSVQNGEFAIHHVWSVQEDGTIKVLIEEYAKVEDGKGANGERDVKFTGLLKKDEKILTDFSPINWISTRPGQKTRVMIRFTPNISDEVEPEKLTELPISGSEIMITDNEGGLWTEHDTVSGKFVGFTTHLGSVFLSYYPFKGASELGFASGHRIELKLLGKKAATLTSQSAFLPEDVRAKVYGIYRADQKTPRFSMTHTRSSNREDKFLEMINQSEK